MHIREFIRESILTQVNLIEEGKDQLIRKIPSLTDDQKEQLIEKYRHNTKLDELKDAEGNPVIDWNRLNKLTWEDFEPIMSYVSKTKEKQEAKVSGANVLFENDDVVVIEPLTKQASICYGKNTKWCTSAMDENDNQFNRYFGRNNCTLIYVINKNGNPDTDIMAKTAVAINKNKSEEYFDAKDDPLNTAQFIHNAKSLGVPINIFKWYDHSEKRQQIVGYIEYTLANGNHDDLVSALRMEEVTASHIILSMDSNNWKATDLLLDNFKKENFNDDAKKRFIVTEVWKILLDLMKKFNDYDFTGVIADGYIVRMLNNIMYRVDSNPNIYSSKEIATIVDFLSQLTNETVEKVTKDTMINILEFAIGRGEFKLYQKYLPQAKKILKNDDAPQDDYAHINRILGKIEIEDLRLRFLKELKPHSYSPGYSSGVFGSNKWQEYFNALERGHGVGRMYERWVTEYDGDVNDMKKFVFAINEGKDEMKVSEMVKHLSDEQLTYWFNQDIKDVDTSSADEIVYFLVSGKAKKVKDREGLVVQFLQNKNYKPSNFTQTQIKSLGSPKVVAALNKNLNY